MADHHECSPCLNLGMVNFINTAPLYIPWAEKGKLQGWKVIEDHPAALNDMLHQGRLDAGLVSSYAYGEGYPSYLLLPGLSISASGPVGSVLLISKERPEKLTGKRVGLTRQSATSTRLLYIILEDFWGIKPEYVSHARYEWLEKGECSAYMAIGDEALRLRSRCSHLHILDLAEIWLKETGLPFVFALWAIRKEAFYESPALFRHLQRHLLECLETGLKRLEEISAVAAPKIPMGKEECMAYLKGIDMGLGLEHQKGLNLFFSMLYKRGDLPKKVKLDFAPIA